MHSHTGLILPAGVYVEEEAERLLEPEVMEDPKEAVSLAHSRADAYVH